MNDLTISPGRLSPEFEVSESSYTAEIPAYETTITPANYQGASFQFLDAGGNVLTDADAARPGHQVQLTAATTTVTILVTSRDGGEDASYTIEISRSPGAPGAPVMNPATPGPSTLALSWSAPSNSGTSPISSYSLRYRVAGPGGGALTPWTVVQSIWNPSLGGLSYDLTGLQPSVQYELQMRAVNNSGPGPWSATVTGATVSALPPGMPLNSAAAPAGQTGIRLSWGRPSSDGGSPITGYRIQASEDGSTWATLVANARPGILTYSHTALSAGSTWHYRVAAINSVGQGPWSNVATASTPSSVTPQVPGPPVNPASTPTGPAFARNPAKDFDGLLAEPWGVWSNGETMWVGDPVTDKIYAYDMRTKARVPDKEFDTLASAGNGDSRGLWSDGETMWVPDPVAGKIFAYDMKTKARIPEREFHDLRANNQHAGGLWSDGVTMWMSNWSLGKIYAYDMNTKERVPSKEFDILRDVREDDPTGIWSDGTTLWIAARGPNKIYAYDLVTRERVPGKDFDTLASAGNDHPNGIYSDGETMWVSDTLDHKLYAYNMPQGSGTPEASIAPSKPDTGEPFARNPANDFNDLGLRVDNSAQGIWSDGETMWVLNFPDKKIYAYDLRTKARDKAKDFDTLSAAGNNLPESMWSNGVTMWVADDTDKIFAYSATTGDYLAAADFNTLRAAGNSEPEGIWSDGDTMWIADDTDNKIYAYDLDTKVRVPEEEFNTLSSAGNRYPIAIWSDGTTMWVSDWDDDKIYAYNMATKSRATQYDFDTLRDAGNHYPAGIWSDGKTMWVRDKIDDKIYAYNMPQGSGTSEAMQ